MRYEVEIEATYRAVVVVEAHTRDEARRMAERGPAAWLDPAPVLEHVHTEAGETWRQDEAGEDEMQSWRDRDDARREGFLSVPMQGRASFHAKVKQRRNDVQAKRVLRVASVRSKRLRRRSGR